MKTAIFTLIAFVAGFAASTAVLHPHLKPEPTPAWAQVDFYAGLAMPVRAEKPGPREVAKNCLALNAYHEARGESFTGQVAVGQVALRRAGLDFRRVCAEVFRPEQFSWTTHYPRGSAMPSGTTWQWALAAAEESLQWAAHPEAHLDYSNKATYFHARTVNPYWTRGLELVAVIGGHYFWR